MKSKKESPVLTVLCHCRDGEKNGKGAAFARRAGNVEVALVAVNDMFDDGQAQPRALGTFAALTLDLAEFVEDVRQVLWWDADACVNDGDLDMSVRTRRAILANGAR